jgi:hypothetical protein
VSGQNEYSRVFRRELKKAAVSICRTGHRIQAENWKGSFSFSFRIEPPNEGLHNVI